MSAKNEISSHPLGGRVALVTGAGRGIGRKCAELLADAGAHVLAVARTGAEIKALAATRPGRIEALPFDVTSDLFIDHIAELEQLDILVNNAGINRPQPFAEVEGATLRAMIELNIHAASLPHGPGRRPGNAQDRRSRFNYQYVIPDGARGFARTDGLLHEQTCH